MSVDLEDSMRLCSRPEEDIAYSTGFAKGHEREQLAAQRGDADLRASSSSLDRRKSRFAFAFRG